MPEERLIRQAKSTANRYIESQPPAWRAQVLNGDIYAGLFWGILDSLERQASAEQEAKDGQEDPAQAPE